MSTDERNELTVKLRTLRHLRDDKVIDHATWGRWVTRLLAGAGVV